MQSEPRGDMSKETQMSELVPAAVHDADRPGVPSGFACPECGGALFELEEDEFTRYRCRVGHAFSPETLLAEQSDSVENSMWTALRALEESAALCQRLARRATGSGSSALRDRYTARARESLQHAENVRAWLSSSFPGPRRPSAAGSKESHGPHPAPDQGGTAKRPQEA
jgi:two-component system chemotaxis response regulator CheB